MATARSSGFAAARETKTAGHAAGPAPRGAGRLLALEAAQKSALSRSSVTHAGIGDMAGLNKPAAFEALCRRARRIKWVVFVKPPFGGPEQVLKYLARYTHRVAISNRRLLSLEDGRVTFEWKDYAHGNKNGTMTLDAVEFIRRFLLHILPGGFMRIRQFGFLANRARGKKLALCRTLLQVDAHPLP